MPTSPVASAVPTPGSRVVLVGGVPGAGKSTAIARVMHEQPGTTALDPDQIRSLLRDRLPGGTPYRLYRPVVHTVHTVRVIRALLAGPNRGPVVVHDPATRAGRRRLFARLARARGWDPVLVYVDVSRASARAGQVRRGRVVRQACFDGHWRRWQALRQELDGPAPDVAGPDWTSVVVVDRETVIPALRAALRPIGPVRAAA